MIDLSEFPFNPPTIADYEARPPEPGRKGGGARYVDGKVVKPKTRPLISVITPSLNAAETIEATIESVLGQRIPGELEYIVVDAGSTDGTLEVISRFENELALWVSEPDGGISDGFNKGVALSTGKYILHAFADDTLDDGHLAVEIEALESSGADYAFADLNFFEPGVESYIIKGDPDYTRKIRHDMPTLNHPTIVARRSAFENHGLFSTELRVAMDYDLFLRWHRCGVKGIYVEGIVGKSRLGGHSGTYWVTGNREVLQIARAHGGGLMAWWVFVYKIFKTLVHKALRPLLPTQARQWLRRRFNRYYRDPRSP